MTKFCNGSFQPLLYFLLSSFLAGSLHPLAGHFVAEHYFFTNVKSGGTESLTELNRREMESQLRKNQHVDQDQEIFHEKNEKNEKGDEDGDGHLSSILTPPETYSYYGPLNIFVYNVGLHNEHHDFPAIPWTKLPVLHHIAREFYEPLPCHRSWSWVIWTFILDSGVGPWCRVKRAQGGRIVGGKAGGDDKKSSNGVAAGKSKRGRGGEGISANSVAQEGEDDDDGWKESEIQN